MRGTATGAFAGAALDICIATGGVGGLVFAAVGGFLASAGDSAWEDINNGKSVDFNKALLSGTIGAGTNALFGAYGRVDGREIGNTAKSVGVAIITNGTRAVTTRAGKFLGRKMARNLALSAVESLASSGINRLYNKVIGQIMGIK